MKKIAEMNSKVNMITADVDWDSPSGSSSLVENTLMTNPDIKVIMTPGSTVGVAANNFAMSGNAMIDNRDEFAVFSVDETEEIDAAVAASAEGGSVFRGTISMGTFADTIADFAKAVQPYLDGGTFEEVNGSAFKVTPESLAGAGDVESAAE